jgi:hypothetical protein
VPDAWSAAPTKLEFEDLQTLLRRQLDDKLAAIDAPPPVQEKPQSVVAQMSMSSPSQQQVESGPCRPVESIDTSVRVRFVLSFHTFPSDEAIAPCTCMLARLSFLSTSFLTRSLLPS